MGILNLGGLGLLYGDIVLLLGGRGSGRYRRGDGGGRRFGAAAEIMIGADDLEVPSLHASFFKAAFLPIGIPLAESLVEAKVKLLLGRRRYNVISTLGLIRNLLGGFVVEWVALKSIGL